MTSNTSPEPCYNMVCFSTNLVITLSCLGSHFSPNNHFSLSMMFKKSWMIKSSQTSNVYAPFKCNNTVVNMAINCHFHVYWRHQMNNGNFLQCQFIMSLSKHSHNTVVNTAINCHFHVYWRHQMNNGNFLQCQFITSLSIVRKSTLQCPFWG